MTTIALAAPVRPTGRSGNDVTADRWAEHLRALGYEVVAVPFDETAPEPDATAVAALAAADVLLALHARRAAATVAWWHRHRERRPVIVALTGTDLYRDMPTNGDAMATVEDASALIVLQQAAVARLAGMRPGWATKATVVHQSVDPRTIPTRAPVPSEFRVVVLAHLRAVKDPLLAARAARSLPPTSTVAIHHAGRALDDEWQLRAETEQAENPRYVWHRELDRNAAMTLLASAAVLACTSEAEGGANVVTEAIAVGVPVIGTRIDGNVGLLGADYPGLVPVGDEAALAELLGRLEHDGDLLADLQQRIDALASLVDPESERAALAAVLGQINPVSATSA